MIWVFLVIALAAISFTITIIMQHLNESSGFQSRIEDSRAQKQQAELEIEASSRARDLSKQQANEVTAVVAKIQEEVDTLRDSVDQKRKDRERRGKYRVG